MSESTPLPPPADKATCERCGSALVAEGLCPKCGATGGTEAPEPTTDTLEAPDRQVELTLARANLLRMRGESREASQECLALLRIDPGNADAHALLGDIHVEIGELTEAQYWYRQALALAPGKTTYQEKLSTTLERLRLRPAVRPASDAARAGEPEWRQRLLPLALTAAAGLVVILTTFFMGRLNRGGAATRAPVPEPPTVGHQPQPAEAGPAADKAGQPVEHEKQGAVRSAEPQPQPSSLMDGRPETAAADAAGRGSGGLPQWTETEAALLSVLQVELSAREGGAFALYGVTHDPTVGTVIVTFESPVAAPGEAEREQVRARAAELALLVAAELPEANILTLRAAVEAGPNLRLVFVGVTTRSDLTAHGEAAVFVPEWWGEVQ